MLAYKPQTGKEGGGGGKERSILAIRNCIGAMKYKTKEICELFEDFY